MRKYAIQHYKNVRQKQGTVRSAHDWRKFFTALLYQHESVEKTDMPCFSVFEMTPTRAKKNAQGTADLLVFDCDETKIQRPKELKSFIQKKFPNVAFCLHSSWNSQVTSLDIRARLIFPLAEKVSIQDFPYLWKNVATHLPFVDKACQDVSRLYLYPVVRNNYYFEYFVEGELLPTQSYISSQKILDAKEEANLGQFEKYSKYRPSVDALIPHNTRFKNIADYKKLSFYNGHLHSHIQRYLGSPSQNPRGYHASLTSVINSLFTAAMYKGYSLANEDVLYILELIDPDLYQWPGWQNKDIIKLIQNSREFVGL